VTDVPARGRTERARPAGLSELEPDAPADQVVPVRGRLHRPRSAVAAPPAGIPPTPADRREALAAALGLPAGALAEMSPSHVSRALDRLAAMTARLHHLEEEAAVDDLTGALRRGAGLRLLQAEIDRVRRTAGRLTLAFADVDGLKRVNDTQGHQAGDDLLRLVGHTLRRRLRSYDLVIRYGGDEFLCAMGGAGVEEVGGKLELVAAELHAAAGRSVLSVGLAELDAEDPLDDAVRLVGRADQALYHGRARRAEAG
jgi:diguanylate cyclase (GGDEF)-like protein